MTTRSDQLTTLQRLHRRCSRGARRTGRSGPVGAIAIALLASLAVAGFVPVAHARLVDSSDAVVAAPAAPPAGPSTPALADAIDPMPAQPTQERPTRAWSGPLPDPRRRVMPDGTAGWLLFAHQLALFIAYLLAAPLVPVLCPIAPRVRSRRTATRVAVVTASLAGFLFARYVVLDIRWISVEYELFLRIADACAAGHGCPLVGTAVGGSSAHLGPLFFIVLSKFRQFSPNAGLLFELFAIDHGIAAGITALLATRFMGARWGLVAGLLFAVNPDIVDVYVHLTHTALAPVAIVAFAWSFTAFMAGGGGRALVATALCLALAVQAHAVCLVLLPPTAIAIAVYRPQASRRAWFGALGAVVALYFTWILYTLDYVPDLIDGSRVPTWGQVMPFFPGLQPASTVLTGLGLVVLAAIARRRGSEGIERRIAGTLFIFFSVTIVFYFIQRHNFRFRYVIIFFPFAQLTWTVALRAIAPFVARFVARNRFFPVLVIAAGLVQTLMVADRVTKRLDATQAITWPESSAIVGALNRRGYGIDELRRHLHGPAPEDMLAPPARIGRRVVGGAIGSEEALALSGCARVADSFARWQETISPRGRTFLVAGYVPQLGPITAELYKRGILLRSAPFTTCPDSGEAVSLGVDQGPYLPDLLPSPIPRHLALVWSNSHAPTDRITVRLRSTLAAVPEDRVLVVRHAPDERVTLRARGVVRTAAVQTGLLSHATFERFVFRAGERSETLPIEVEVVVSGREFPKNPIDLYEEPFPQCERPAASIGREL